MGKFFDKLKKGLEEIAAYEEGKITLYSDTIEVPAPPAEYTAQDIKRIREMKKYSQGILAKIMNVSVKTIQSWESGNLVPNQSSRRLLEIVERGSYNPPMYKKN